MSSCVTTLLLCSRAVRCEPSLRCRVAQAQPCEWHNRVGNWAERLGRWVPLPLPDIRVLLRTLGWICNLANSIAHFKAEHLRIILDQRENELRWLIYRGLVLLMLPRQRQMAYSSSLAHNR